MSDDRERVLRDDGAPISVAAAMIATDDDYDAILALPGVRTLGDLKTALDRGDVPDELAATIRKALGVVEVKTPMAHISARGMKQVRPDDPDNAFGKPKV